MGAKMFDEEFFKLYNEETGESTGESEQHSTPSSEPIETISYGSEPKKTFVLSIGGSVIAPEKPDSTFISKLAQSIEKLHSEGYAFAIVVGGGKIARNYIAAAKSLGAGNYSLDWIGILATRLNALVLIQAIEKAHPAVLTSIDQASEVIARGKIPVFGGLMPGFTTDAIAALVAEALSGEYINLTNVDGIYSSDPKENPRARFFEEISYEKLLSLMKLAGSKPGQNLVIDVPACLILKRSTIPSIVLDGKDLENFENAVRGLDFKGTRIVKTETSQ